MYKALPNNSLSGLASATPGKTTCWTGGSYNVTFLTLISDSSGNVINGCITISSNPPKTFPVTVQGNYIGNQNTPPYGQIGYDGTNLQCSSGETLYPASGSCPSQSCSSSLGDTATVYQCNTTNWTCSSKTGPCNGDPNCYTDPNNCNISCNPCGSPPASWTDNFMSCLTNNITGIPPGVSKCLIKNISEKYAPKTFLTLEYQQDTGLASFVTSVTAQCSQNQNYDGNFQRACSGNSECESGQSCNNGVCKSGNNRNKVIFVVVGIIIAVLLVGLLFLFMRNK